MDEQAVSVSMRVVRVFGLLLLSAVGGCADVRVVRESPEGGIIAMPMNNNCWPMYYRNRAKKLMNEMCPDGYEIDREEFVWDGKPGPEGHRAHDSYFGYTDPADENAPYLRKEYWIAFRAAPQTPKPAPDTPPRSAKSAPSSPHSSPPSEDKQELPPPRRLQNVPE